MTAWYSSTVSLNPGRCSGIQAMALYIADRIKKRVATLFD